MSQWVRRLLLTVTVLATIPLVLAPVNREPACDSNTLDQAVEQLADDQKRTDAQSRLEQCSAASAKSLAFALNADTAAMRVAAAKTLGQIGWEAKSAVPALVSVSQEDSDLQVRSEAVRALSAIGRDSQSYSDQLRGWQTGEISDLQVLQQQLNTVLAALEKDQRTWPTKAADLDALRRTRNVLQTQWQNLTDQPSYQVVSWVQAYPWIAAAGLLGLVLISSYGGIFLLRPIWLLKVGDELVKTIARIPAIGPWLSSLLQGLVPLKYHSRVLDAWVAQQRNTATANFTSPVNITVGDRAIHVPLPVKFNGNSETEFGPQTLRPCFQQSRLCLLITGEGGAGKTSLACQIARWGLEHKLAKHAILPILIEQELEPSDNLLEVVQGRLQALVAAAEPLDPPLIAALLRKRRILVIVDHLSEMTKPTQTKICPADREFPIHALIVTSRLLEPLGGAPKTVLEPMRVEGNRLSEFVNAYLTAKGKRHLFEDEDYFEICRRLSRMVGQRNITVLLAKLYVDQAIEQQQGAGGTLPDSVPELMLSYLNQLNRAIEPANQCDPLQVQQDAGVIAWQCLKQTYRPAAAKQADILAALAVQGSEADAENRLIYLETRLRLLQTLEPGNKLRIVLDPLAEYLAAHYLVDWFHSPSMQTAPDFLTEYFQELSESQSSWADPEAMWRQFFASIDQRLDQANETPETIQGFLLAVRDCCLAKPQETRIPAFVPEELARKAGLDPENLRLMQEKRRVRLLISELSDPELKYRLRAAEDLSQLGTSAKIAAANLIGMLENRNQILEARQAAAQALGKLGMGAENLLALLTDVDEELDMRRSAAEALGVMKAGTEQLLRLLEDGNQPLRLRQSAARGLSLIGAPSGAAVPMLIVTLQSDQAITQVKSIPVWKEWLSEELSLDLVQIPAGEFVMGSPPEEVGRDWYKNSYPELEGVDVEAQHRVAVSAFAMSQFPITQAQWRFVASLPRIKRDLDPDPAHFKGGQRPVEAVSWYDVIEFCARLSQHTDKTYRLPSEAEWEYACRAGTTQPFHFGEILSTDLANYDGTYSYGNGEPGVYRQQTTEVGSFGVVNGFGLADMHGTVWEWCLDHWHPSYQGAPTDGSAWVADGNDRYRVLRGGSWFLNPGYCRSAYRGQLTPGNLDILVGFRVVCVSPCTLQCQNR
ncbi:SUMF1/EgtB/PvdO family nonheme iron enzyme [Leptolyngbya sp. NK1-12]|uniref:SUMF1/EgtB/PvdO family nonheme iron enzyme n=1 Tax=Leptolyngbya sp. NK1-12 TaxID=2547451 RepID=A0AA96WB45_9CYAN|nr:SUMF1/EgtB/PvdO family nonheme iron enzyme [Leptolyngbya sp. NK1-12]